MKKASLEDEFRNIATELPHNFLSKKTFCLWKYENVRNNSKPSKVPYRLTLKSNIIKADVSDSKLNAWVNASRAMETVLRHKDEFSGIGFVIYKTDLFALDLDNCFESKKFQLCSWAQRIVKEFQDTYIEISPSGKGLHIIGRGKLNFQRNRSPINKSLEAYDGNSIRYLTITGNKFSLNSNLNSYKGNNISKEFYNYEENDTAIRWLQSNFFLNNTIDKLSFNKYTDTSVYELMEKDPHAEVNKKFLQTKRLIEKSKDANLFFRYQSQQIISKKSKSKDDWHFCLLILNYMNIANPKMLEKFLYRFRGRPKLQKKITYNLLLKKL